LAGAGGLPEDGMAAEKSKKTGKAPASTGRDAGRPGASPEPRFYRFKIQLESIKPPIWRDFYVPASISLAGLHDVIQTVMGWDNDHLYSFTIFGEQYYDPEANPFTTSRILDRIALADLGLGKGSRLRYQYDFGDDWYHRLTMTDPNYRPADPGRVAGCLAGARACPPEDCGGPYGYLELMELLAASGARRPARDPDGGEPGSDEPGGGGEDSDDDDFGDDEDRERLEWLGEYNPDEFDLDLINSALR
jgi:hypothetical protein